MLGIAEVPAAMDTGLMSAPYALVAEVDDTPAEVWRSRFGLDWQDTLVSYSVPKVRPTLAGGKVLLEDAPGAETELIDEGNDPAALATENLLRKSNTDRLNLLVKKYAEGRLSQEQDTRLKMATNLVRGLIRRMDAEGMEHLGALLQESEGARQASADLRKRLGL
jgi:hypothetical protein